MAVARGIDLKAACAFGSTWGTNASDPTTNALLPLLSSTLGAQVALIPNDELRDVHMRGAQAAGIQDVTGTWTRNLHYQGDERLHGAALGSDSVAQVGTTAYYTHTITSSSSLQGKFLTLFEDREVSTWEVASAKVNQMTISGSRGERIQAAYDFIGDALNPDGNITWGSVTQNAASVNNHVLFSHLSFYVNDSSAGDVTSGSVVGIDQFSIAFNNNLGTHRTTANTVAEPVRDGFFEVTGSITIPTYENDDYLDEILDKTLKKMAFVFTSGSYSYKLFLPAVRFSGDTPTVGGPGRVSQTLNFTAEAAVSAPTGMGSTLPYVAIVSQDSVDYV